MLATERAHVIGRGTFSLQPRILTSGFPAAIAIAATGYDEWLTAKYDVLGIGNAIFDVLVQTDEGFLGRHGMTKGGMALIDEARAASIYRDMGPATEMSGGSAANTIVGLANLGARAAYVGKVKDDQIGRLYTHDIRAAGVAFETRPASDGPATGCSYILVTPDGERTMNTYLGAAQDLTPADIDAAQIAASRIVYLEGYLWDPAKRQGGLRQGRDDRAWRRPPGRADAVGFVLRRSLPRRISRTDAQGHGRSDLRQRGRTAFAVPDLAISTRALKQLRDDIKLGVVTRSEKGCVVASKDGVVAVPAFPIDSWWTPPAPAICSPPAFCSAWCATPATKTPAGSARSRPPK